MNVHNLDRIDSHKSFTNLDCPEYIMFGNMWRIFGYKEHFFAFLDWKYLELKGIWMVGINARMFTIYKYLYKKKCIYYYNFPLSKIFRRT